MLKSVESAANQHVQEELPFLEPDEPAPYEIVNREGRAAFLIVVDHASARIPRSLGTLGLPDTELRRHIAWDIGALAVARRVATALDAALVWQNYSRLVIDCNRDPNMSSSIPLVSETTDIPGNFNLSAAQLRRRRTQIFEPYHGAIRGLLDERRAQGRATILIAQHSMTDVYENVRRPMHAAVLYDKDRRFAHLVLEALRKDPALEIADNEPYFVSDNTDYTVPRHAAARNLPYVELELRQDLIESEEGQAVWADRVARALRTARTAFDELDAA